MLAFGPQTITSEISSLENGSTIGDKLSELTTLEKEVSSVTSEASQALNKLPLLKSEAEQASEADSSVIPAVVTGQPGVIKGITIKGNIGDSEASLSSGGDVTQQVIEK